METQIVNFSLPRKLLQMADKVAEKEARTRSELFREALRIYLIQKGAWEDLSLYEEKQIKKLKLKKKQKASKK